MLVNPIILRSRMGLYGLKCIPKLVVPMLVVSYRYSIIPKHKSLNYLSLKADSLDPFESIPRSYTPFSHMGLKIERHIHVS